VKRVTGVVILSVVLASALLTARWIGERYVPSPRSESAGGVARNPAFLRKAKIALEAYSRLPERDQEALRANLRRNIVAYDTWVKRLRESDVKLLCLGENHEDTTRQFLAEKFFNRVKIDVLVLEATPEQLGQIGQELRWQRKRVLLLGADIAGIIRAARGVNPDIELVGAEETKSQWSARREPHIRATRDDSIQSNFWGHFRYGPRYAILFGALHCQEKGEWLFGAVHRRAPRRVADKMLNVRAVEVHQEGPVEALAYFLQAIGVQRENFVVIDTKAVHPQIYEWFDLLGMMLKDFSVLMVFRNDREIANG
jgi:hypothetical protein